MKRLERLNSGEASINVIQFAAAPRPDSALVQLAEQNRGKHVVIDIAKYGERPAAAIGRTDSVRKKTGQPDAGGGGTNRPVAVS